MSMLNTKCQNTIICFVLIIFSTRGLTKKMFSSTIRQQEALSDLTSRAQENLAGAHIVRLFHQQNAESEKFKQINYKVSLAELF